MPGDGARARDGASPLGTVPWAELVAPAARLAREGVELTAAQGYLHRILDRAAAPLAGGRRDVRPAGRRSRRASGSRCRSSGTTLERIGGEGADVLYSGELARAIVEHVRRAAARCAGGSRGLPRGPARGRWRCRTAATSSGRTRRRRAAACWSRLGLQALGDCGRRRRGDRRRRWRRRRRRATARSCARSIAAALAQRVLIGHDAHLVVDARRRRRVADRLARLGQRRGGAGTGIHLNNMLGEADLAGRAHAGRAADVDDGAVASCCGRAGRGSSLG